MAKCLLYIPDVNGRDSKLVTFVVLGYSNGVQIWQHMVSCSSSRYCRVMLQWINICLVYTKHVMLMGHTSAESGRICRIGMKSYYRLDKEWALVMAELEYK